MISPSLPIADDCETETESPTLIQTEGGASINTHADEAQVGQSRHSLIRRRAFYLYRFAYYAVVHRGFAHVKWALEHEGTRW